MPFLDTGRSRGKLSTYRGMFMSREAQSSSSSPPSSSSSPSRESTRAEQQRNAKKSSEECHRWRKGGRERWRVGHWGSKIPMSPSLARSANVLGSFVCRAGGATVWPWGAMIGHDVQAFRQPRARIPTYSRMEFVSHVIDRCTGSGENHLLMTVAPWISGALEVVVDSHHSPNFLETRFFLPFSSVKVGTRLGRSNNGHLLTIKAFLSTEGWHQRSGQSELFAICCESHSMSGKREYDTGLYSTFHVLKVAGGSGGIVAYRSQELVVEKLVFWWRMST